MIDHEDRNSPPPRAQKSVSLRSVYIAKGPKPRLRAGTRLRIHADGVFIRDGTRDPGTAYVGSLNIRAVEVGL